MNTQLNLDAIQTSNPISSISKVRNFADLPPAEQRVQAALYMGYFDNLFRLYFSHPPMDEANLVQKIIMDPHTGILSFQKAFPKGTPLGDLYAQIVTDVTKYPEPYGFGAGMLLLQADGIEAKLTSTALSFLQTNADQFSLKDSASPDTLMLFLQFMSSLNNNPNATSTAILENFLGQEHAGDVCHYDLAAYCNSYLQATDNSTLFPIGSAGDPNRYQFFKDTLSKPTQSPSNYATFFDELQSVGTISPIDTPQNIQNHMGHFHFFDSIWNPSSVMAETAYQELALDDLDITTDIDPSFDAAHFLQV